MDGTTMFALGSGAEVDPGREVAFDGTIDTPSRRVAIATVEGERVLEQQVAGQRTRVRVWTHRVREPDEVMVGLDQAWACTRLLRRGPDGRVVHTNTVENVFSVFKRGMVGVYQHCGEAHLHRYLAEFDFRRNRRTAVGYTDGMRTDDALKGIEGKRLTYRPIGNA